MTPIPTSTYSSRSDALRAPTQQLAVSRFISRTYGWMFLGLLVTAGMSFAVSTSDAAINMIMANRGMFYILLIGEFLLVMALSAAQARLSATAATLGFLLYSALNGVTFSVIFLAYTMASVGQVFLISAGMFGGLALYGTVTKKDLTGMGSFVGMGLWGLILVGFANMFIHSESLSLGLSAVGVLVFSGLAAYDAQRVRAMAYEYAGNASYGSGMDEAGKKGAVFAALSLYLNFINLFLSLLRLFGNRRR